MWCGIDRGMNFSRKWHSIVMVYMMACFSGGIRGLDDEHGGWGLPSLLHLADGRKVESHAHWMERREEIRSQMEKYFIGSFPENVPQIVEATILANEVRQDGVKRVRIGLTLETPNQVSFEMTLLVPSGGGPNPLLLTAPKDYQLLWAEDAVKRGYVVCLFPGIDSHHREKNFPGYDNVWEKVQKEYSQASWTEISTKGWLASRCIDYLLSPKSVAPIIDGQIAIIGFSRYGKQAMIAAAYDSRITCVVARSPGSPASSPYRLTGRNTYAEAPADFPGRWFLPSLRNYLGREDELPMDAHGWYALIAPRSCLVHTAHNDGAEPSFAVEKGFIEGRSVYRFLGAEEHLHLDYRTGGHRSSGDAIISLHDRNRNLDWIDLSFGRASQGASRFQTSLIHAFDWERWKLDQGEDALARPSKLSPVKERIEWLLGDPPDPIPAVKASSRFLTDEESSLMTHDRWAPAGVKRVPIRFGEGIRGNLYFKDGVNDSMPVVIWLHPYSYHSGYNEGYGVQGTTVYHRIAQNGYAVIAYDQCGFGLRLLEGAGFYDDQPQWSRMGRMVHDARAAIRFARTGDGEARGAIPELDPDRVILLGYSAGALTAMFTAALEDSVAGVACFSGWNPLRSGNNRYLWDDHALLPRLGLYRDNPENIPVDFDEIIREAGQHPTLIVTPEKNRFADLKEVNSIMKMVSDQPNIFWQKPNDINRFQRDQHGVFLKWADHIIQSPRLTK